MLTAKPHKLKSDRADSNAIAKQNNSWISVGIAVAIISCWLFSLVKLLTIDLAATPLILILMAVALRAFLHTGIFIIIHEAIHGVIVADRRWNDRIGYIASTLYAFLPYRAMSENHHLHHLNPATEEDPDFYSANPDRYFRWYFSFMREYQSGKQFWILFWGMTVIFWSLIYFQISAANLFLFLVIPIIISSLQLFTFGIFIPHKEHQQRSGDRHQARSINYPVWLSFLACYHFGYHWEHHQHPYLPWYKLPLVRD